MSGGHFEYSQFHIGNIAESIESEINKSGKEIPKEDRWNNDEWYEKYPEDKFYTAYSEETLKEFHEAVRLLKRAEVYAQRIDYLLSGDDGEETFHERLKEDLSKL